MLHDVIYTFHMPLFMFASGYVYIATKKEISYGQFLMKKIKRLMLPYFVTSAIIISIKILTQGSMSVDNPVTAMSYLRMFYLPEAGYFLWFIWALWWMFVIVPLFKTPRSRAIFFLLCLVIHYVPMNLPTEFCIAQFKSMLVYFMLGVFVFENRFLNRFIKEFSINKFVGASLLFVLFEVLYFSLNDSISFRNIIGLILPFIGILFILELSKIICYNQEIGNNNFLMIVSVSSYIIYLFHTTFEGFTKAIVRKLPFDDSLWYIFLPEALVVIVVGVVGPIVLHRYVLNRWRITRVLFGLGK